ncbi:TPM domain-containing protein [Thermodesulfobacteriota bacterium]
MKYGIAGMLLCVAILITLTGCREEKNLAPILERQGLVNDYASVFTEEESTALESDLKAYEKETCHQIVVLTVPTLAGESISDFSTRTATAWDIGQPRIKNGILISIAMQENGIRIEAASGLDFLVNEGIGQQILDTEMIPLFREGRITEGITNGVAAIKEAARRRSYPDNHRPSICR